MEIIGLGFIISAFIAGILTFLAPCTLPLVPAYLGFISGVSSKDLENPETAQRARRKIFLNGVFFILGFSLVFIVFGTLAGVIGQGLVPYRIWLTRIGGILVILFGLFMLGAFNISFLQTDKRIKMPSFIKVGKPTSSLAIGAAFYFNRRISAYRGSSANCFFGRTCGPLSLGCTWVFSRNAVYQENFKIS